MPAQKNRKRLPPANETPPDHHSAVHHLGGAALARHLMDPQREHTVVVVSHIPDSEHPIDAQLLADRLGAEAWVFNLANGAETHRLQEGLPEDLHVYGTGARVYPHGHHWQDRVPRRHLPRHSRALAALYEALENEVLAAGQLEAHSQATAPVPVISEAVVKGFPAEDRAMVELVPGGERAVIRSEDLLPGIPLDWLVSKKQLVMGTLDRANHVLNIAALLLPRPSPITVYKHGDVALARVKSVCPALAVVELWPGNEVHIGLERISSNDLDSAQDLLTEGEVVRARVLYENGAVRLSMLDVDDDEAAVPAPPLLRDGPPWLDIDRPYASIFASGATVSGAGHGTAGDSAGTPPDAVEHGGVSPAGAEALLSPAERRTALQGTQMQLEAARRTIAELVAAQKRQGATDEVARALQDQLEHERNDAARLSRSLNSAEHQITALKHDLAKTKASLVQLRQQRRSASSRTDTVAESLFLDPGEQFNFELLQAWARVVPAGEKPAHPLGNYSSSQQFLASLAGLTEQQRSKTLRAVVDLVAERRGPLRKREPHPLRLNEGAHAGPTLRGEDVCMRLYVEQGTAGALRLHYWKLQSGGIELHEVVPHDVVKP